MAKAKKTTQPERIQIVLSNLRRAYEISVLSQKPLFLYYDKEYLNAEDDFSFVIRKGFFPNMKTTHIRKNCICVKFEKLFLEGFSLNNNDHYILLEEKTKIFENVSPMLESIEKTETFMTENALLLNSEKDKTTKTFINCWVERFDKSFDEFQTIDDLAKTIALHSQSLVVGLPHYAEAMQYTTVYDETFMVIGTVPNMEKKWGELTPFEKQKFFEYATDRKDL